MRVSLGKTGFFNQNSLFIKISTNVLPLLPSVMSMRNVPILVGLIAADAKLVFLETEKLVKVCEGLCGKVACATRGSNLLSFEVKKSLHALQNFSSL